MRLGGAMKYARLLLAVGCLLSTAAAQWLETTIQVGEQPYEQLYVPPVNKVYCTSQHDHSVSIIDCATNTVRGTIYAAHFPVAVSYSDVYNRVYIACDSDTTIVIVDAVGDTVIKNLRCDGGPGAAAYCRSLDKLYVLCGGHVDVIDAAGDSMVKRIQVPLYHRAIEWCPTSNLVFFANDRGDSMTVIDCSTDQLRAVHAGSSDFWQIRWNPRDNRVYAVSSWVIHVFNCTGDTLIDSIVLPA
jgi:YVTN family beta-propeller protein